MSRLLSRRPSPALVVAVIALIVATAGTGYAALKLPKNSVGSKQIKKNAVTAAKIKKNSVSGVKVKDHSLTGQDVDLSKLGTVPSATNASHASVADSANALAPPEAVHLVGAPGEPPFLAGSGNAPGEAGVSFTPVGFFKDHDGIVHLQGLAHVGTGPDPAIFALPPGFRPGAGTISIFNVFCTNSGPGCETDAGSDQQTYTRMFVVGSNVLLLGLTLDGQVLASAGSTVSLEGITFRAAS